MLVRDFQDRRIRYPSPIGGSAGASAPMLRCFDWRRLLGRLAVPVAAAALVSCGGGGSGGGEAAADTSVPDAWAFNGQVMAAAVSPDGKTIYVGGDFDRVGPRTGGFVPTDPATGLPLETFP